MNPTVKHVVDLVEFFCREDVKVKGFNFELIQDGEYHILHYGVSGLDVCGEVPESLRGFCPKATTPCKNSLSYRGYLNSGLAREILEHIKPYYYLPIGIRVHNARIIQRDEPGMVTIASSEKHTARCFRQGTADSPISSWIDPESLTENERLYLEEMSEKKPFTVYKTSAGKYLHLKWNQNNHLTLPKDDIEFRRQKLRNAL